MPSCACCLQCDADLLPPTLNEGIAVQVAWAQRLLRTLTMPSVACFSQYAAFLHLSTLWAARLGQKAFEHTMFAPGLGGKIPGRERVGRERDESTPPTRRAAKGAVVPNRGITYLLQTIEFVFAFSIRNLVLLVCRRTTCTTSKKQDRV